MNIRVPVLPTTSGADGMVQTIPDSHWHAMAVPAPHLCRHIHSGSGQLRRHDGPGWLAPTRLPWCRTKRPHRVRQGSRGYPSASLPCCPKSSCVHGLPLRASESQVWFAPSRPHRSWSAIMARECPFRFWQRDTPCPFGLLDKRQPWRRTATHVCVSDRKPCPYQRVRHNGV